MIERHYGTLLDGAGEGIASRLDALETELEQATAVTFRAIEGTRRGGRSAGRLLRFSRFAGTSDISGRRGVEPATFGLGSRWLDLGCGTGGLVRCCREQLGVDVWGFELGCGTGGLVRCCREQLGVDVWGFEQGKAEELARSASTPLSSPTSTRQS